MKSYPELAEILAAKSELLRRLQSILEEEQRYIVELKADDLNEMSSRKQEIAEKIKVLEKSFREVLSRSFRELGMAGEISLSPVIGKLNGSERESLIGLRDGLFSVSRKIDGLIAVNRDLLGYSLRVVGRSMAFFKQALGRSDTYGNAGRMADVTASARIICKEI